MTRICAGHEGHACDVSLEGEHHNVKRCASCGPVHKRDRMRNYKASERASQSKEQDYFSLEGATVLKRRIESYWANQGHEVTCKLVRGEYTNTHRRTPYYIKSDMANGQPAKLQTQRG